MSVLGKIAVLAIVSAGACYLVWKFVPRAAMGNGVISVCGGERMEILIAGESPHYLQGDAKWADDRIGGSAERIGSVGCTLCSVAMGLDALGHRIEPGTLNVALIEEGGYTDQGWLIWAAVGRVTGEAVEVVVEKEPRFSVIDLCLRRGWFALVKFYLPGRVPHWVLVVGKRGDDYLVKDPAYSKSPVVALSKRARAIHSVRYLRPVGT